jgi:hypothetical protein
MITPGEDGGKPVRGARGCAEKRTIRKTRSNFNLIVSNKELVSPASAREIKSLATCVWDAQINRLSCVSSGFFMKMISCINFLPSKPWMP